MARSAVAPAHVANGEIPWQMPHVEVGQVVLWSWNTQATKPSPALVLAIGQETLSLAVHNEGRLDHALKSGARHKDDPKLRTMPPNDGGCWDLLPRDRRIDELLASTRRAEE